MVVCFCSSVHFYLELKKNISKQMFKTLLIKNGTALIFDIVTDNSIFSSTFYMTDIVSYNICPYKTEIHVFV